MSRLIKILAIIVLIWLMGPGLVSADSPRVLDKNFSGAKEIHINLASSDCVLKPSGDKVTRVRNETTKAPDRYKPEVSMENGIVTIGEEFSGSGLSHGRSRWSIRVPKGVAVTFRSASGDLEVEKMAADLDVSTASGDVELNGNMGKTKIRTASGDIESKSTSAALKISTASGDVDLRDASGGVVLRTASGDIDIVGLKGKVSIRAASGDVKLDGIHGAGDVRSASGDIEMEGLEATGAWTLSAASGSIEVKLGAEMKHDMTLSTASGSVVLDFDGNPIKGSFELLAALHRGEIRCSEKGKTETVFRRGTKFSRFSFSRGDQPAFSLRTHSGTVEIRR